METGPFGPIYRQFKHNGPAAIRHLMQVQTGECIAALWHPELGDIDLVWGAWTGVSKGSYGLAKIVAKHGQKFKDANLDLAEIIPFVVLNGVVQTRGPKSTRLVLSSGLVTVVLVNQWVNTPKNSVLTAYLKDVDVKLPGKSLGQISVRLLTAAPTSRPARSVSHSKITKYMHSYGYLGSIINKFSPVVNVDRRQITTRPELFQGRQVAFSQETVDKILREGFDTSQEPIAVWQDPKTKEYVVISGHSRFHASGLLFAQGHKHLAQMPVKVFNGTLDEAIDYAVLESNRSGTAEGLKSDLAAYKRASEKGKGKDYLLSIFKTEARVRQLQDLSHLNPKGRFMEYLGEESEKSFPYLQRNAQWVGMMRKMYPSLTNSHENELWQYLYGPKGNAMVRREIFFETVEKRVGRMDFNPDQPLNLYNVATSSAVTQDGKEVIKSIERDIEDLNTRRVQKEINVGRAVAEGKTKLADQWREEISLINQAILRKVQEKERVELEVRRLANSTYFDLFSTPGQNAPAPMFEPEPKPRPKPAAAPVRSAKERKLEELKERAKKAQALLFN